MNTLNWKRLTPKRKGAKNAKEEKDQQITRINTNYIIIFFHSWTFVQFVDSFLSVLENLRVFALTLGDLNNLCAFALLFSN